MSTNKIVLRTVEEVMNDYVPVYTPIYPLFLPNGKKHIEEVGKTDFKRLNAVGDIRAKHIGPKDTEIRQVSVMDGKKTFKKYFLANQYITSDLQDQQGAEEVVKQVLDEHHIQADELLLLGDGTAANNVLNNGLYWSSDPNYVLENSYEVPTSERLSAFFTSISTAVAKANQTAGRKVVMFYGSGKTLLNSLFPTSYKAFRAAMQEAYPDVALVEIPDACTPSGASGFIVCNLDQTKLHYTRVPELLAQDRNAEKMYYWFNFMLGSMMLEVTASKGIVRQPITLAV